jgi:hypothetical protein
MVYRLQIKHLYTFFKKEKICLFGFFSIEIPECAKMCIVCFTDSIEANVESSEVHVERATDQLQRAAYYQVKARVKESHSML